MDDLRFAHVATDPRFKSVPKRARKLKIDSRFRSMFNDKRFKVKYFMDRRGRRVNQTSSEDLRKYYQLEEDEIPEAVTRKRPKRRKEKTEAMDGGDSEPADEEEEEREEEQSDEEEQEVQRGEEEKEGDEEEEEKEEEGDIPAVTGLEGESPTELSDSGDEEGDSDTSSTDTEGELFFNDRHSEQVEHEWGEGKVSYGGETSGRLAACNMDWDRLSAHDLYILFNSFKPQGGIVHSVTIYPSDFGLERMSREDIAGPVELVEGGGGDEGGVEGGGYSREKLREYQWKRLQYYYAVVQCDSKATAEHIYERCDGLEYEHSGGQLDLRFVPEGMTFDDRKPKSIATEDRIPPGFKPSEFITSALQQSKVNLTWDETDPRRLETTMRQFTKDDSLSMDFNAYLASSGSSDETEGENRDNATPGEGSGGTAEEKQIQKYRALLEVGKGSSAAESNEEMEITWEPGLKETAEDLVKRKKAEREVGELTSWEKYLKEKSQRRREKKRRRKKGEEEEEEVEAEEGRNGEGAPLPEDDLGFDDPFFQHNVTSATAKKKKSKEKLRGERQEKQTQDKSELELLLMEEDEEKKHFSLSGILKEEKKEIGGKKKRRKRGKREGEEPGRADNFNMDVHDPRFSALFDSHLYAPDPVDPQYKPTKGMAAIMAERQKRRGDIRGERGKGKKEEEKDSHSFTDPGIRTLVKSVKSKTTSFSKNREKLRAKRQKV